MLPTLHLQAYLNKISSKYPNVWKNLEVFRSARGQALPEWPDWCFVPLALAHELVTNGKNRPLQGSEQTDRNAIIGLGTWRMTQGVYQFDPDVFQSVWETPINGDIPANILFHLPEWCVYIPTPGVSFMNHATRGFFAWLEYNLSNRSSELRFLMDLTEDRLYPFLIYLEDNLEQSLRQGQMIAAFKRRLDPFTEVELAVFLEAVKQAEPFINLLLYLASQAMEITHISGKKPGIQPQKTKKGLRYFPASQPTVWDVGIRLGAALRSGLSEQHESQQSAGGIVRPHIRRAHWHTYWTGQKGEQKAVLKWLPPIPVKLEMGNIIPTIRPVG